MKTTQLPLLPFDGLPRAKVETSYRAAVKATPKTPGQRARVLAAFVQAGARGLTDAELVDATGLPLQSVTPRRGELARAGEVERAWGETRKNKYGNDCQVWRLTNAAKSGR